MDHDGTTRAAIADQENGGIATKNCDSCGGVDASYGHDRGGQSLVVKEPRIAKEGHCSTVVSLYHRRSGVQTLRND
jgi:hypothetical protein